MRISDWSSDVCSSDLIRDYEVGIKADWRLAGMPVRTNLSGFYSKYTNIQRSTFGVSDTGQTYIGISNGPKATTYGLQMEATIQRSEEHTSELQSLMRSSYAVFCLTNKMLKQLLNIKLLHYF